MWDFGAHPTILLLNKVSSSLPSNQDFLVFHYVRAYLLHERPPVRGPRSPNHFVQHPPTRLSMNSTLIFLVGKPHELFTIHIDMILSTLHLNPHGFVHRLISQTASYQLDFFYAYILKGLPILIQCGTCGTLHAQITYA